MRAATRTTTAVAAVLVAGAASTATAGTAAAAPAGARLPRPLVIDATGVTGTSSTRIAGSAAALDDASPAAGYAADISASTLATKSATTTFVVPVVRCTANTTNVLFAALFLQGTDTTGATDLDYAYVVVSCQGTTPTYSLFASATGADPNGATAATAAGDTVRVDQVASKTTATSTVTDVTSGASASQTGSGFGATFVQASVQGGDGHSVFPRFGKVHFTRSVVLGKSLQALGAFSFQATDAAGNVKISTSALDSNGKGFTTKFVANFKPTA